MKTWVALIAVFASAGTAFAQQTDDPVERQVQRYKDQLTLTDDQVSKVRDILKKEREDLRSALTDDQKTKLDQPRGNRGANFTPGAGGFGGARSNWLPPTNDLKTQLSLTDDQVTKINEIRDALRQQQRTFFRNRGRNNGGNPADDFAAFQEKSKQETTQKIRDLLTDEQKPKFDEALKAYAAQQPAVPDFGGRRGGTLDERVARVMDALKVEDSKEATALKGLIHKVMELMDNLDTYQRESRTKIDETSRNKDLSDTAVGDKIQELLKGHRDIEKDLTGARKELTEVVTNRQELELLRRGILR